MFIVEVINMKFNAILVAGLFLFTSFLSAAGGQGQENNNSIYCESCENTDRYELFNKTYFVLGKRSVTETFYMENGSMVIGFGFHRVSRYFTGQGHIRLYDEEAPKQYAGADTCVYLFGVIILPWDAWIYEEDFTPGLQTLVLKAWGFGWFTLIIYGES